MEFSAKLAGLAKRLPVSGELEVLVRGIGESKSKPEEDAIVQRMIQISKQQIRDGIPRKSDNTKPLKDLLVYLVYINMLGHETSWALPAVIQMCSHKSLTVKKAAYLATSLLIDPSSELTIMVTATIQADLKSDNFLVVCTALQAISRCAGPELVSVFLPQVIALLRHDKDQVKKKSLLALHRLLQLDPSIAPDVERHLVDKLGYKEPSVMFAALAGLHELVRVDPAPYRNLVHYFTNILKQASEGKLGRSWDYHRAPAPFVQMSLLRLLAMLGAGDAAATSNMTAVILEVWRRADALASTTGNALVFECMRTATAVHPSDALLSQVLNTVPRFLASKENNLRYAGVDILARVVSGDAGRVEQFQLAIVDCLRSPDVSLKRKTLDLLFKMAGPDNIDVIAREVLAYLKDSGDDVAPRRAAAVQLLDVAERFAPSLQWFADTILSLLEESGDVAPAAAADALIRVVVEGSGGDDPAGDDALRRSVSLQCFALADRAKLSASLLRVVCWVLGSYGLSTGKSFEAIVERVASIPETQAANNEVLSAVAVALGKLKLRSGQNIPGDAAAVLESMAKSESTEVQQVAAEVLALIGASSTTQRAALSSTTDVAIDAALPFLDDYVNQAAENGAPPYLSLQDRVAMGVTRAPDTLFPSALPHQGSLKFQAYEATQAPVPGHAAAVSATTAGSPSPAGGAAGVANDFFDGLDLGGMSMTMNTQQQQQQHGSAGGVPAFAAALPPPLAQPVEQQLKVDKKGGRKWSPNATAAAPSSSLSSPGQQAHPSAASPTAHRVDSSGYQYQRNSPAAAPAASSAPAPPVVNPEQQRLAASLFGGGGGGGGSGTRKAGVGIKRGGAGSNAPSPSKAPEVDLLGDMFGSNDGGGATMSSSSAVGDLLGGDAGPMASASAVFGGGDNATAQGDALAALSGLSVPQFGLPASSEGLGDLFGSPVQQQLPAAQQPAQRPAQSQDPFANLLD